ncbi:MAG: hypothetical protein ABT23_11485 [Thiobacillus sp. SCN 63-57]|uniref:hypothetical protein n=1 Tax=Thiobacillus sp. SCN 63-57 TaxID=1660145 RepID=UPI0008699C5B|nr:hypothetical protein [Thiobacillus sp. SCN 63-57]ODV00512.1 MAG: hypothetical protein ABT23_11485 [Thiobacillus sp. SCN 63-57]
MNRYPSVLIVSEVVPDATSVIVCEASKNVVVTAWTGAGRNSAQNEAAVARASLLGMVASQFDEGRPVSGPATNPIKRYADLQ